MSSFTKNYSDKNVIMHVGFPRTGSTFMQNEVFPLFKDTAFISPQFIDHNYAFNLFQYTDDLLYDSKLVQREINKIKLSKILISHEMFTCNDLFRRSMVATRLKELFPNARIILFLRGQLDLLTSLYNYSVNNQSYSYSIDKFYWIPDKNKDYTMEDYLSNNSRSKPYVNPHSMHLDCFKYFKIVELYKKLFNDVKVFLYEDFLSDKIKTIGEICKEFNEFPDFSKIRVDKRYNSSKNLTKTYKNLVQNAQLGKKRGKILFRKKRTDFMLRTLQSTTLSFIKKIENDHYFEDDNNLIINKYPEIGIQKYPELYMQ